MSDPYYDYTEREARAERFEESREARRQFEPIYHERKTMTHYELLQACRAVRDNLGRTGYMSIDCQVSEWPANFNGMHLRWLISFQDDIAGGNVQVGVDGAENALVQWTELMRQRFGPQATVPESELAATLDAHRIAENAA